MGQDAVHDDLERCVALRHGTGQLRQNHVQLLLARVPVNADDLVAVDDDTDRVTTAEEVLGQRSGGTRGVHQRVAADGTGLGDGTGIDEDNHVGHRVTLAFVDHEFPRAGVSRPVDRPEGVAFEILAQGVELRTWTGLSDVDRTGENLRHA